MLCPLCDCPDWDWVKKNKDGVNLRVQCRNCGNIYSIRFCSESIDYRLADAYSHGRILQHLFTAYGMETERGELVLSTRKRQRKYTVDRCSFVEAKRGRRNGDILILRLVARDSGTVAGWRSTSSKIIAKPPRTPGARISGQGGILSLRESPQSATFPVDRQIEPQYFRRNLLQGCAKSFAAVFPSAVSTIYNSTGANADCAAKDPWGH